MTDISVNLELTVVGRSEQVCSMPTGICCPSEVFLGDGFIVQGNLVTPTFSNHVLRMSDPL
jgi:hypothetical protein